MVKKKRAESEKENRNITNLQVSNVLDVMEDTTDNDKTAPGTLNSIDRHANKNY